MYSGLPFLNKDEDDFDSFLDDATTNEKSNLVDIFECDLASESANDVNPTLKYIPPKSKQPQKLETCSWNVIVAKIVSAFKLVNDNNTSTGQLGLALLNNSVKNASKLILYKTKEEILSTLIITKSSKVYWKPPYLQYHDDVNGFWSLLFPCDSDYIEFIGKLEEVCDIDRGDVTTTKAINSNEKESIETVKLPSAEKTNVEKDKSDEVDTATVKTKSDVVYRVAKIGHQLPKIKPIADDDSDSTLPSDIERMQSVKPVYSVPEKSTPNQLPSKPANISVALQPSFWPISSSSTFDLNAFSCENRIQNTEVRVTLTKLDLKLDRVLDSIERLRINSLNPAEVDKEEEIIKLEEKLLELKKENRTLKLQLTGSEQVYKETNENDKEKLLELQKINEKNELQISMLTSKLQEMEQKLTKEIELKEKEKTELNGKHTNEIQQLREELERKTAELEAQKQQQQQQQQQQQSDKSNNVSNNGDLIRSIMNQFYVKLYTSIEGKESMSSADILKLTAEIIRKETKAALNSN